MEQLKFTRKKQFTTFLETTVLAKRDEIRQLESIIDNKLIDTLGYFFAIEYTQQYSYEAIFVGYDGRKAIIDNMQRTTLLDLSYLANNLMEKMDYQIKYLQFVIKYGKLFDNYKECIEAWQEFVKNDTIPTKIDTESVENVETTEELSEKDEKEVARLMEMLREEMSENDTENVEKYLPDLGETDIMSDYERYLDMAYDLAWQEEEEEEEDLSENDERCIST